MEMITGILPDLETDWGRAWRIDLDKVRAMRNLKAENDGTIIAWVVEALWAHPAWGYYFIAAVHLRPTKQMPVPKIMLDGATHEAWVIALAPDEVPDLTDPMKSHLRP